MDFKLLIVSVAVCLVLTEAHRRKPSRYNDGHRHPPPPPPRDPPPPEGFYSWRRDLGNGYSCEESAYAPPNGEIVVIQSADPILAQLNMMPSATFIDFSSGKPVEAVMPIGGPCFIQGPPLTLDQTLASLDSFNGTQITTLNEIPMDGTAVPLTPEQVAELLNSSPVLAQQCSNTQLIPLYPAGTNPVLFQGPTEVIQVFILNSAIQITVPQQQQLRMPYPHPPRHSHRYEDRHRYQDRHRGGRRHRHH